MNIVFRIEASSKIGFGHLVRCLSIANNLKTRNKFSVSFIINNFKKAIEIIENNGFITVASPDNIAEESFLQNYFLDKEPSVIIFDNLKSYSIEFVQKLKQKHKIVLVHSYDESRFYANMAIYPAAHLPIEFISDNNWKKHQTNLLYGIDFIWLNEKILKLSNKNKTNENVAQIVFIAGGSDPSESLLKFYNWVILHYKEKSFSLKFLYGEACNYLDKINTLTKISNIEFMPFDENIIQNSDFAVCAFGVTTYELIYLNIPTISYGHSPLHSDASKRLADRYGCILDIGLLAEINENTFITSINSLISNFEKREDLRLKCKNLIDGKGIDRFIENIELITTE